MTKKNISEILSKLHDLQYISDHEIEITKGQHLFGTDYSHKIATHTLQ